MKARLLKKLLNNPQVHVYLTNEEVDYKPKAGLRVAICIDDEELFQVFPKSLKIKYVPGVKGMFPADKANSFAEYYFKPQLDIWNKLHELVNCGEMREIIDGIDDIEDCVSVFKYKDGRILEVVTDSFPGIYYDGCFLSQEGYLIDPSGWYASKIDAFQARINQCTAVQMTYMFEIVKLNDHLNKIINQAGKVNEELHSLQLKIIKEKKNK